MAQMLGTPSNTPRPGRHLFRESLLHDSLAAHPEVFPPEPRSRHLAQAGLVFIIAILVVATVTSAVASGGVFAVIILGVSAAVAALLLHAPPARRPALYQAAPSRLPPPERIGDALRRSSHFR